MVSSQTVNTCSGKGWWLECAAWKSCIAAGLLCMPCICYLLLESHIVEKAQKPWYAGGWGRPGLDSLVGLHGDEVI